MKVPVFMVRLLSLFFWFSGLRFYDMKIIPSNAEVINTTYTTAEGHPLKIVFYREIYVDFVYRMGHFSRKKTESFIVEGIFEDLPEHEVQRFNRIRYTFDSRLFRRLDDEVIARVLTGVYINFLTNELLKSLSQQRSEK